MHTEGLRLGLPELVTGTVVDPYVIDREMDRYRKGRRTLGAVCEHYGIALEDAHEAEADALAAAHLARTLAQQFPNLRALDIMTHQADWHAERQRDFADYLVRQGAMRRMSTASGRFADSPRSSSPDPGHERSESTRESTAR